VASVTAQVVASGVGLWILASGRVRLRLRLRDFAFDGAVIWRIAGIGLPASVQMGLRALMANFLTSFAAGFGRASLAAFTIGMSLEQIAFMPAFGIADASAALVGQNLGAGKPDRARRSAYMAMFYTVGVMGSLGLVFALTAQHSMGLFGLSAESVAIGTTMMRITAASLAFSGMGISLNRALSGAGDTLPGMILTVFALWGVQVPLAWYLKGLPSLGVAGIWVAMACAAGLQGLLTLAYFSTGRWQRAKA
jgi:Na+-driven multidrug efflux pump